MPQSTDPALLERSCRLANEAVHAAALQHRRLRSAEPEDDSFVLRWWTDLQFLIVGLRRLRRAGELATRSAIVAKDARVALDAFDSALPSLKAMRNVGEHIDAYALDSPRRHDTSIDRRQLEVGMWDGRTFRWLRKRDRSHHELDSDAALAAAENLHQALQRVVAREREAA